MGDTIGKMLKSAISPFTNPKKFFTKDGILNSPFIDPGQLVFTPKDPGGPKNMPTEDAAAAATREQERRRLATSGSQTTFSGRRSDALSASIGKRYLGTGS